MTISEKDGKEISDCSWMAPNSTMSCWEKAHAFCIRRGLFGTPSEEVLNQEWSSKEKLKFANAAMLSECCLAKRTAFGLAPMKRGGRLQRKTPSV
jgi:hypothetical protein